MTQVVTGKTLQESGSTAAEVYFPNGGVYSVMNEMRDGALVEVATIGREGMLGVGVFLGDAASAGRTLQQVSNGDLPTMAVARFARRAGRLARSGTSWVVTHRRTFYKSCSAPPATRCTTSNSVAADGCCRHTIASAPTTFS